MVARFISGNSIRGILRYNEEKVTDGEAELIMANGFATDIDRLNFHQKLYRFETLNQLKPSVKSNAVHITLNFHEDDHLDQVKLQKIVAEYMEKIGFGEQPYIAYQHHDANHPHIHIATNRITREGKDINVNKIGYRLSEPARKDIEVKFNLIRAEGRELKNEPYIKPAEYGAKPTKKQLNNITKAVMIDYAYTSFAEFKAVLAQFNVNVDRGKEDSIMFEKRGLTYSIADENGKSIGIPFKASSFYKGATMKNLEKNFGINGEKRKAGAAELKSRIDKVFLKYETITEKTLLKELASEQVALILRRNENGLIYGATFVDHKNKTVFKGSDLDKSYTARSITERISHKDEPMKFLQRKSATNFLGKSNQQTNNQEQPNLLDMMLAKPKTEQSHSLGKKRKRKKGPDQSQNYSL